jgi:hypothetical protein
LRASDPLPCDIYDARPALLPVAAARLQALFLHILVVPAMAVVAIVLQTDRTACS